MRGYAAAGGGARRCSTAAQCMGQITQKLIQLVHAALSMWCVRCPYTKQGPLAAPRLEALHSLSNRCTSIPYSLLLSLALDPGCWL
jgi:hypothetical protein